MHSSILQPKKKKKKKKKKLRGLNELRIFNTTSPFYAIKHKNFPIYGRTKCDRSSQQSLKTISLV